MKMKNYNQFVKENLSDNILGAFNKKRKSNPWYSIWESVKNMIDNFDNDTSVININTGEVLLKNKKSKEYLYKANDYIYDKLKNMSYDEVEKLIRKNWKFNSIEKEITLDKTNVYAHFINPYLEFSYLPYMIKTDAINQYINKDVKLDLNPPVILGSDQYSIIMNYYVGDIVDDMYLEKIDEIAEKEPTIINDILNYETASSATTSFDLYSSFSRNMDYLKTKITEFNKFK